MVYKSKKKLEIKPVIRHLKEIKEVLYDQKWAATAADCELYYMYRGMKRENGFRYDITVIPFQMLGQEFIKTKGHYHVRFRQELYEVLEGKGIFLMQKTKGSRVEDVYAIKAKKGDILIVPPHYGHITINPGKQELKMANWVSENCKSDYSFVSKKQGGCYFAIKEKGRFKWVKNENYQEIPKLRFEKPLQKMPKDLSFLK